MGIENPKLYFEEEAMDAYTVRVSEYRDSNTGIYYY